MVCCSSQLIEEKKIEARVVTQRAGDNSFSETAPKRVDIPTRTKDTRTPTKRVDIPTRRAGDAGSSAVRFGGTTSSTDATRVETGEEEFSRRTGFGQKRAEEEADSGEDWGGVSSSEEEDQHEHGDDEEWRGGEGGESWDASGNEEEEYEGEDWGVQSLGTKCITAFDCV